MGQIRLPDKVKLFIGIIGVNKDIMLKAKNELENEWGDIDFESEFFNFNETSYYKKEMGENLLKKFYSFKRLVHREYIADIKIKTNQLEEKIKINKQKSGRNVNLDPGYVTLSNVTLATTKDYRHRIYLTKGIYLENTLYYDSREKRFIEWEWTYPDYCADEYKDFFNKLRDIYRKQLKYGEDLDGNF